MVNERVVSRLRQAAAGFLQANVDLSNLTRWRIGGYVDALIEPTSEEQTSDVLRILNDEAIPYCVVGETSNLLFDSAGFSGVIIRIASSMSGIEIDGVDVKARAGTAVPELARAVGAQGLSGIEHTVGIPGTIGGLVLMNGGSQRKGIGTHVVGVKYVDRQGVINFLTHEECEFSYRASSMQNRGGAIVEVNLRLNLGDSTDINSEMNSIVASRRARFPEDQPNCGSTFLSNPEMYSIVGPPGKAIEEAGLKGIKVGGAQISSQHANFINNVGGATSEDVIELIAIARRQVFERTGFLMDAEARYVDPSGNISPAHVEADRRWRVGNIE